VHGWLDVVGVAEDGGWEKERKTTLRSLRGGERQSSGSAEVFAVVVGWCGDQGGEDDDDGNGGWWWKRRRWRWGGAHDDDCWVEEGDLIIGVRIRLEED